MSTQDISQDELWMYRALTVAREGLGTTSPNPPVGAVIVKDGLLLGEGFHERAGEPHAERRAIANAILRGHESQLKGATIYVTLEPCSSYGRTPPCTEAIIQCGISEVVYASTDPDTRHQGRADAVLSAAGVRVRSGVCKEACDAFLRPWVHSIRTGRPWVVAKIACSLDGRMTRRNGGWLSCAESVSEAHQLRLESDAILVGGNTVRTDDPALTIRSPKTAIPKAKIQPWRIILTRDEASLPATCKLLSDDEAQRTLVFEQVDELKPWLESLYKEYGIVQLMLECGGKLLRTFLEQGMVNEWMQIVTPRLCGGPDEMLPGDYLPRELAFEPEYHQSCGTDILIRGIIR